MKQGKVASGEGMESHHFPQGIADVVGRMGLPLVLEVDGIVRSMIRYAEEHREGCGRIMERIVDLERIDSKTKRECQMRRKRVDRLQSVMACLPPMISSLFFLLAMSTQVVGGWIQKGAAGASVCSALAVSALEYLCERNGCQSEGRHTLIKGELQDSLQRCRGLLDQLEGGEGCFFRLKLLFSLSRGVNRAGDAASNADL